MTSPARRASPSLDAAVPGRILAIDYGRRRIGLALSDELRLTAQPLTTLERENRSDDLRRLRKIVREHNVDLIVVGHPVRLDGTAGEMAEEAGRFAKRLEKELGLPVEMMDERLSSWEAEEMQAAKPSASRKRKAPLDQIAAAVILRDYLERHRRSV